MGVRGEGARVPWGLGASPGGLGFVGAEGELFVPEHEIGKVAFVGTRLVVKVDASSRVLVLSRADLINLLRGLGMPLATRWFVQHRVKWFVPIGVLLLLSALPLFGGEIDLYVLSLGASLTILGGIARFRPSMGILVADLVWVGALLVQNVARVLLLGEHPGWLFLGLRLAHLLYSGIRDYRLLRASAGADSRPGT